VEQFDSIISNPDKSKGFTTVEVFTVHKLFVNIVPIVGTSSPPKFRKDIEIIPENPTEKIVLQIEEIPPPNVFYNLEHRAIVKRRRNKRKIYQTPLLTPQAEMMNVVWKAEVNPSEDLTKLSQYARAYTTVTMDKASEVSHLLKEKYQAIIQLEAQSVEQQQKIEQLEQS